MNFLYFYAIFLIDFAFGKQVKAKRYHCNAQIREINMCDDMVPAYITSKNYSQLICALRCFGIDRAEVAGWQDHRGVYVLYSNGAVVPALPLDLPDYALYTRTKKDCKTEILLVRKCSDGKRCYKIICKTVLAGEAICEIPSPEPCHDIQQSPCYKPDIRYQSQDCINPPCYKPEVCYQQQDCNTEKSSESEPEKQIHKCHSFPSVCKKSCRDKCSVTNEILEKSTKFVFEEACGDFSLTVYQEQKDKKQIYLTKPVREIDLVPRILNHPRKLLNILQYGRKKFHTNACLYIDKKSKTYILANGCLYSAKFKWRTIKFKYISEVHRRKLFKKGLFLVEFI